MHSSSFDKELFGTYTMANHPDGISLLKLLIGRLVVTQHSNPATSRSQLLARDGILARRRNASQSIVAGVLVALMEQNVHVVARE
jgi:hypothetical protein